MTVFSHLRSYVLDSQIQRWAVLSIDHHLVVIWICCTENQVDLPGKPRRPFTGHLAGVSVRDKFNSHLQKDYFFH